MVQVELDCLTCGEIAGMLENRPVIRQRVPGAVRLGVTGLSCGRCGGALMLGAEERSTVPTADQTDDSLEQ